MMMNDELQIDTSSNTGIKNDGDCKETRDGTCSNVPATVVEVAPTAAGHPFGQVL